jgi:pimeloyl-ACP methyl ester carboxylesterase
MGIETMETSGTVAENEMTLPAAKVSLTVRGSGRPFVFLHPGEGLYGAGPFIEALSRQGQVIVPTHPGFGRSEIPPSISSVDDLSYLYLDLLKEMDLEDVVLVGSSFGGWIAAEMAVKNTTRIGRLVLLDALGIKIGDRFTRDIADMHALSRAALAVHLYADPSRFAPDFMGGDPELSEQWARDREAFTYFGWQPYMHNPKLLGRLHRIDVPTLVIWGEADRVVSADYGRAFADAIPGARFSTITRAGHMPHIEKAAEVAAEIAAFTGRCAN